MPDDHKVRVLISGGGISGLALAIALRRSYKDGEIVVLEKVKQIHAAGSGMSLIGHTLVLLHDLGVDVRKKDVALKQNDVRMVDANGEIILQVPTEGESIDAFLTKEFGSFQYNIHRGELQKLLLDRAIQNGVIVKNNARVVDIEESNNRVMVTINTGDKYYGSVLIGADGANSAVREIYLKKKLGWLAPSINYRGYVCWRGLTNDPKALWDHDHPVMFKTIMHRKGYVSFTAGRMSKGRTFWVCDTAFPQGGASPSSVKQFLLDCVGDDACDELKYIINATEEEEIIRTDVCDGKLSNPFTHSTFGRVCVIGDAAHPMVHHFGQGACMAVEDAFQLIKCLDETLLANDQFYKNKSWIRDLTGQKNKPSLKEVTELWPEALRSYDRWGLSWGPRLLLGFSRLTGYVYMTNGYWFNLLIRLAFFNPVSVWFTVSIMSMVLFKRSSYLRTWSKRRVRGI